MPLVPFLVALLLVLLSGHPSSPAATTQARAAPAAAPAQAVPGGLCSLLPSDFSAPSLPPGPPAGGLVDSCLASKQIDASQSYGLLFIIRQYDNQAAAHTDVATLAGASLPEVTFTPTNRYGDESVEGNGTKLDYGITGGFYEVSFRRGCFTVYGQNDAAPPNGTITLDPALVQNVARSVDDKLKTLPPCPSEQPSAPAPSTLPALKAGLACDTGSLQDLGQVVCTASTTDQAPGAQIVFDWTLDGQAQPGTTGSELSLDNLAEGAHTVTVVARDTANAISADPQSASFTRSPSAAAGGGGGAPPAPGLGAPGTSPTGGGSHHPVPLALLTAGPAVAVGAALGALLLARHRRRLRAAGAGGPGPTEGPGRGTGPVAPPAPATDLLTPPVPPQQSRRSDEPHVDVSVRVSTSIRTRGTHSEADPHLWGDGVDIAFAEYDVRVTPPTWVVDNVQEINGPDSSDQPFVATSVTAEFADHHEHVTRSSQHFPPVWYSFADGTTDFRGPHPNAAPNTQAAISAKWCDQNHPMIVGAALRVTVRNPVTNELRTFDHVASPPVQVEVIGARTRLEFWADPAGPAYADGSCTVRAEPALFVFDQDLPYPGGLEITRLPDTAQLSDGTTLRPDDYLQLTADPYPLDVAGRPRTRALAEQQQGVTLRCRFHLTDDAAMKRLRGASPAGCPVSYDIRPTGHGAAETSTADDYGWLAADHYQACRDHLPKIPPDRVTPAVIELLASDLRLTTDPVELPRIDDGAAADQYRVRLAGLVRSRGGDPVKGSTIRSDRPSGVGGTQAQVDNWALTFHFVPPTPPQLLAWDPTPLTPPAVVVEDVDEEGHLTFRAAEGGAVHPWYDYDHWKLGFDTATRYLRGQSTRMTVTAEADLRTEDSVEIFIGPPCKLYVYQDKGRWGKDVTGHLMIGLIDALGREVRCGVAPDVPFPLALGMLDDAAQPVHDIDVGRGWDLTLVEFKTLWQRIGVWKEVSDLGELTYAMAGLDAAPRQGSCVSFIQDIFSLAGIQLPMDWGTNRPGNLRIDDDPRREDNPAYTAVFYRHPWIYSPRAHPGLILLDGAFGTAKRKPLRPPGTPPAEPEPGSGPPPPPPPPTTKRPGWLRPKQ
ncbi:hypothetical protein ACFZDG_34100 [Kitasatospora xanthocidica]|uniref:hypothetical protein n=1 Tax=Kitasatospora xanthocidica TaxID=83382 RepID=UPI0036E53EDE